MHSASHGRSPVGVVTLEVAPRCVDHRFGIRLKEVRRPCAVELASRRKQPEGCGPTVFFVRQLAQKGIELWMHFARRGQELERRMQVQTSDAYTEELLVAAQAARMLIRVAVQDLAARSFGDLRAVEPALTLQQCAALLAGCLARSGHGLRNGDNRRTLNLVIRHIRLLTCPYPPHRQLPG